MSRNDSSHSSDSKKCHKKCHKKYYTKCDKIFIKIPREALKEWEGLFKELNRNIVNVYREANRNPILAYRIFKRVMNNFSVRANLINDQILISLGIPIAMLNRQELTEFPIEMAPLPQPPTVTPPLLPPVTPPPRPPAVPPPGLLQVTAIRNIIQQAAIEIRRLSSRILRLHGFIESLNVTSEVKDSLELLIDSIFFAKIEEVRARATEEILTVLTGI